MNTVDKTSQSTLTIFTQVRKHNAAERPITALRFQAATKTTVLLQALSLIAARYALKCQLSMHIQRWPTVWNYSDWKFILWS